MTMTVKTYNTEQDAHILQLILNASELFHIIKD